MRPKITPYHVERQFEKLVSIADVSVQIEEIRKILSHFINLLKEGSLYEECYYSALTICENIISQCDVTERDSGVLCKILNTILEIVNRDYVSKKVVTESLAAVHNIMRSLYHVEAKHLHEMLRAKLPYLSKYFNEMNNFTIMSSIVGIIYEYVYKYDQDERKIILTDVMKDFYASKAQFADILSWPPKLFKLFCRKFLNNIPGRKYFSLAARSAELGGKKILPIQGDDFISFDWNTDPKELSFNKFRFSTETNTSSEVSVEYKDITAMNSVEEHGEPHFIVEYEKMMAAGVFAASYALKIYALDNKDFNELERLILPLVKPVEIIPPTQASDRLSEEIVLGREKFYNTMDFSNHTLVDDNGAMRCASIQKDTTPEPVLHSTTVNDIKSKESSDEDEYPKFKPFDMQWKLNLIESSTKNKCLKKDPYDIAYMRAEDKEQQKGVPKYTAFTKRASNAKSFANGKSPERMQSSTPTQSVGAKSGAMQKKQQQWMPKYSVTMKRGSNMKSAPNVELPRRMESSTPTKSGRSKVLDNLDMDKVDLSSIGNISNDDIDGYISNDSEKSDATYVPYAMLSKTETRGRGNQKGRKRQSKVPARVPPKRSRVNIKAANKNSRGTGRETSAMCGNELKRNGLNCEPSAESTMQVDDEAMNDSSCQTLDSTPSKIPNRGQNVQPQSKFLCKRLNAKQTTTQTTTHVTTTQTTEVGIGSRTETGNRPTAETAVQEDVHMALPTETMAAHATQKIYKTLLKVEEHKEYRIECEVKEKECEAYILSQGDRAHILSHVNKIVELLNQPRNIVKRN